MVIPVLIRRILRPRHRNLFAHPAYALHALWQWVSYSVLGRLVPVDLADGVRLLVPPAAVQAYVNLMAELDQREELETFVKKCRPGMRLFDLGAHYGAFTMVALRMPGRNSAVAVDASERALSMTRIIARRNGLNLDGAVRAAIAAQPGREIDMVDGGVVAAGYMLPPPASASAHDSERVATTTIDALAEMHGHPSHIKIDIEGYEADALKGAGATLARAPRPLLFIECHTQIVQSQGRDPLEVLDLLTAARYEAFTCAGERVTRSLLGSRDVLRIVASPR